MNFTCKIIDIDVFSIFIYVDYRVPTMVKIIVIGERVIPRGLFQTTILRLF